MRPKSKKRSIKSYVMQGLMTISTIGIVGLASYSIGKPQYQKISEIVNPPAALEHPISVKSKNNPVLIYDDAPWISQAAPSGLSEVVGPAPRQPTYADRSEEFFQGVPYANKEGERTVAHQARVSELEALINDGDQNPAIREELSYNQLMAKADGFISGVYVLGWNDNSYRSINLDAELDKIKNDYRANTVVFLSNVYSDKTKILPGTPNEDVLIEAIEKARAHGLIPGIRLQVEPSDAEKGRIQSVWRANIGKDFTPAQWNSWFDSMQEMGDRYVQFAHDNDIPFMVMLNEMNYAQKQPRFNEMLVDLEAKYDGVLVYQPNFDNIVQTGTFVQGTNSYSPIRDQTKALNGDRTPYTLQNAIQVFANTKWETEGRTMNHFRNSADKIFNGQKPSFVTESGSNNFNASLAFGCAYDGGLVKQLPKMPDEQSNYFHTSATIYSDLAAQGRLNGFIAYGIMGEPLSKVPCARDFQLTPESGRILKEFFNDPFNYNINARSLVQAQNIK